MDNFCASVVFDFASIQGPHSNSNLRKRNDTEDKSPIALSNIMFRWYDTNDFSLSYRSKQQTAKLWEMSHHLYTQRTIVRFQSRAMVYLPSRFECFPSPSPCLTWWLLNLLSRYLLWWIPRIETTANQMQPRFELYLHCQHFEIRTFARQINEHLRTSRTCYILSEEGANKTQVQHKIIVLYFAL